MCRREKIEVKKLIDLFQAMFNQESQTDYVTIITIRNTGRYKSYSPDFYGNSILPALQKHISENTNYVVQGDTVITVDVMANDHIANFDRLNTCFGRIEEAYLEFENFVLDHIPEICYAAIKNTMIAELQRSLYSSLCNTIRTLDSDTGSMEVFCTDFFENFIKATRRNAKYGLFFQEIFSHCGGSQSIFVILFDKFFERKRESCSRFLSDRFEYLYKYFEHITSVKYRERFNRCIMDILPSFISDMESEEMKESHAELNAHIHRIYKFFVSKKKQFSCRNERCKYYWRFLDKLPTDGGLLSALQVYFDNIQRLAKGKLQTSHNKIPKGASNKLIATIAINQKVNYDNLFQIYCILRNLKISDNTCNYQSFYIENGKSIGNKDLLLGAAKYRTNVIKSRNYFTYLVSPGEKMEVITTIVPTEKDKECVKTRLLSYKNDAKKDVKDCLNYIVCDKMQNETVIKVTKHNDLKRDKDFRGFFDILKKKHLEIYKNEAAVTWLISVDNKFGSNRIAILFDGQKDNKKVKISIIYSLENNNPKNKQGKGNQDNYIKFLYNVNVKILNSLRAYLQDLQFLPDSKFEIPNLYALDEFDIFFSEETTAIDIYKTPASCLNSIIKPQYAHGICVSQCAKVSVKEIIDFECNAKYRNECMYQLAYDLGMEAAQLNKLLLRFVLNRSTADIKTCDPAYIDMHSTASKVELFTMQQCDGSTLLNICEVKELRHSNYTVIDPDRMLQRNCGNGKHAEEIDSLGSIDEMRKFISVVISYMVTEICTVEDYVIDLNCFGDVGNRQLIMENLMKKVRSHFPCDPNQSDLRKVTGIANKNLSMLCIKTLKDKIDEEMQQFVKIIIEEIANFAVKRIVRTTSLRIKSVRQSACRSKKSEKQKHEEKSILTHFNCQICKCKKYCDK